MKYYELTYLISPDISETELRSFSLKIGDFIQEEGGKTEISGPLKKRRLGYSIKKKGEAYWGALDFHLLPDKLPILEKKLKAQKEILRYLILTKELTKRVKIPEKISLGIKTKIRAPSIPGKTKEVTSPPSKKKTKKVELKEIGKKLEEILGE